MKIKIVIDTDNDAFQYDQLAEVLRIFRVITAKLMRDEVTLRIGEISKLYDVNGNNVGTFKVIK